MYQIDEQGWAAGCTRCKSPHFDAAERPAHLIVVHGASLPDGEFGNGLLQGLFMGEVTAETHPELAHWITGCVSTHFLIDRQGEVTQFVSTNDRAWHAGQSEFEGETHCNRFSIGIELEGSDDIPYTDKQYEALDQLVEAICETCPIRAVRGHSDIAPGRKTDPGPAFDWSRVKMRSL